ncbi:4651_t:CDS:2, partial [Acaulospora morrowiae]
MIEKSIPDPRLQYDFMHGKNVVCHQTVTDIQNALSDDIPRYWSPYTVYGFFAQTLPETLKYRDPQPLLKGSGWKRDKTTIPQYFFLAGAGEGKSRTAQELPKLLIECTNDVDLENRLRSALVFNLSFENGTKLLWSDEKSASNAIGNRMLFQLLQQPGECWDTYVNQYYVTPAGVLSRVAKHRNQEYNDLNVIIILDGLQAAIKEDMNGTDKNYFFTIVSLHLFPCQFTTIESFSPSDIITTSENKRNPVFVDNPVMKMLINDMGGHGRALEALVDSIRGIDLDNINFIDLINN